MGWLLVAVFGVTAIGSLAPPAFASSATQRSTICVALVVDATSIGGSVSTDCAKVHHGATGIDVLQAAGHTLTFRNDGILCTIDGQPSSGCAAVDDTHFWAYYHRAPGSTPWSYSNEGPATYQPANDSTEGWVYRDGHSITPRNVPYGQICNEPMARHSTQPQDSTQPRHSAQPSILPKHLPSHSARPLPPPSSPAVSTHPKATIVPEHRRHLTSTPAPHKTVSASPPQPTPPISTTPAAGSGGGHGGLIGVIVAAGIVAALGGAAVVSNRRRS